MTKQQQQQSSISQHLVQKEEQDSLIGLVTKNQDLEPKKKLMYTVLIGYLYFLQGIILSIGTTMPYVYPQLPTYDVLSLFALATIPFSFKFLIAPFTQKFTFLSYGKRKFWIITSQITTSSFLFVLSAFTAQQYQNFMAVGLLLIVFCICLQDISLDAMAIKQLKRPQLAAILQAVGQTSGLIFGSLILMKFSSKQFAQKIGFEQALSSPQTILRWEGFFILIPTVLIHFKFRQTLLKSQLVVRKKSLIEIYKLYRVFLNLKSRFCRYFIVFFFFFQGLNFFKAGYQFELIHQGFKRDDLNTISNVVQIPIAAISCLLSTQIAKFGIFRSIMTFLTSYIILATLVLLFFPMRFFMISIISFIMGILNTNSFIIYSILVNSFPITGLSGMFITMLACSYNFGHLVSLHLKLIGIFGFYQCSFFGLLLQIVITVFFKQLFEWMNRGQFLVDVQFVQKDLKVYQGALDFLDYQTQMKQQTKKVKPMGSA